MNKASLKKIAGNLAVLIALLLSLVFVTANPRRPVFAMLMTQKNKVTLSSRDDEPMKFVNVQCANHPVEINSEFDDSEDWLKTCSFRLKNISDKDIMYFDFYLTFPDSEATGTRQSYKLHYGQMPNPANPPENPKLIKPNEEVDIPISDHDYSIIKPFLERRQPIKSIHELKLRIETIVFADGVMWNLGDLMRQDPVNPRLWHKIK